MSSTLTSMNEFYINMLPLCSYLGISEKFFIKNTAVVGSKTNILWYPEVIDKS